MTTQCKQTLITSRHLEDSIRTMNNEETNVPSTSDVKDELMNCPGVQVLEYNLIRNNMNVLSVNEDSLNEVS